MKQHNSSTRNKMLLFNILFSGMLKAVSLGTSLLIVPVTLGYLNKEVYGIWMIISSILYWFTFFDVGLGNGMRNYLTEAISRNDYSAARSYLSTTLFTLSIIAIFIIIVSVCLVQILNLNDIFNTYSISNSMLKKVILTAIVFTSISFVVKNIGIVFMALQKYAYSDMLAAGSNVASLLLIFLATRLTDGSLMLVILIFTVVPVVFYLLACIPVFNKYPQLRPSFKTLDIKTARKVIAKGLGFFAIQMSSCLVIFGSSNLFITQVEGPEAVTTYNIAYKYFHLIVIGYTIVLSPMWSAYTDAYVKKDFAWIGTTFKRALFLWGISVAGGIVMLFMANFFYRLWVGDMVSISWEVSASVLFYITFFNLNNCVTYLINGLNKITVQIITSFVATIAYIGLAYIYGPLYGIVGICLSMGFCYAAMSIIHLYQCHLLIWQKAKGIWNL